jgi:prefoldin subunit 5
LPSYQANKADDLARKKAELENKIQVLEAAIRDLDSRVTTLEP